MPRLVAVAGRMYSGKDTLGEHLVAEHGYTRLAFADAVKEFLVALDPVLYTLPGDVSVRISDLRHKTFDGRDWAESAVDVCNRLKGDISEVRRLLQAVGTDAGTTVLGQRVWVDLVLRRAAEDVGGPVVITDMRFPYEADAVLDEGGVVLRVTRPSRQVESDHPSETQVALIRPTRDVVNEGTVEDYLREAVLALESCS